MAETQTPPASLKDRLRSATVGATVTLRTELVPVGDGLEIEVRELTHGTKQRIAKQCMRKGRGKGGDALELDLAKYQTLMVIESCFEPGAAKLFGLADAPRIAELSDGGYVVTWNSTDNTFFGQRSTYAQIYDDQGREVGVEFLVNDALSGDQVQPRAEGLSNGTFVLMWTDNNARDGSGQGVFAQRYQNDGTTLGDVFQINDETSSTQNQPRGDRYWGGALHGCLDISGLRDGGRRQQQRHLWPDF